MSFRYERQAAPPPNECDSASLLPHHIQSDSNMTSSAPIIYRHESNTTNAASATKRERSEHSGILRKGSNDSNDEHQLGSRRQYSPVPKRFLCLFGCLFISGLIFNIVLFSFKIVRRKQSQSIGNESSASSSNNTSSSDGSYTNSSSPSSSSGGSSFSQVFDEINDDNTNWLFTDFAPASSESEDVGSVQEEGASGNDTPAESPAVGEDSVSGSSSIEIQEFNFEETIILGPNEFLEEGEVFSSPSGRFEFGLVPSPGGSEDEHYLILQDAQHGTVLWTSMSSPLSAVSKSSMSQKNVFDNGEVAEPIHSSSATMNIADSRSGGERGYRCYLQSDGNLLVRNTNHSVVWGSRTYDNPGAYLALDDGGRLALMSEDRVPIWVTGIPRGYFYEHYKDFLQSSSNSDHSNYFEHPYNRNRGSTLTYPIRGIFYYPWYPQTWTINGKYPHYEPTLGYYSSSDISVMNFHVDALEYAKVDLAIASWWGQETNLDRARIELLMDLSYEKYQQQQQYPRDDFHNVQWTIYYEDERENRPSVEQIRDDLRYIKKWFAWHPAWAYIDGKPVIMIYNNGPCDVVDRWMEAANGEWHVVMKLFAQFRNCPTQPDGWHQYGTGSRNEENGGYLHYEGDTVTIAPGFWLADQETPRLPRVSAGKWCDMVQDMVDTEEPWQLIISFNEAGEGTFIEPAIEWTLTNTSNSVYGDYLDCLHKIS